MKYGTEWFRRERILRYNPRIMPTIGTLFCSLRFGIDPFTPIPYGSSLLAIKHQYQQSNPQVSGFTNHLTHQIIELMQKDMKPNKTVQQTRCKKDARKMKKSLLNPMKGYLISS